MNNELHISCVHRSGCPSLDACKIARCCLQTPQPAPQSKWQMRQSEDKRSKYRTTRPMPSEARSEPSPSAVLAQPSVFDQITEAEIAFAVDHKMLVQPDPLPPVSADNAGSGAALPCPFCGTHPHEGWVGDDDGGYFAIECTKCFGTESTAFCGVHGEDREDSLAIWNRRIQPASTPVTAQKDGFGDGVGEGKVHELKCWPEYFAAVRAGVKPFEVRKDDRDYKVGDTLWLREWSPVTESYSGDELRLPVRYILRGTEHLTPGYCVLGLPATPPTPQPDRHAEGRREEGMREALTLATSIWRTEYQKEAPDWIPLDTVAGVISQIDNMFAGIRRQRDEQKQLTLMACRDWAEDDTAIKAICAKYGIDTEGDSYGVPTMVDCVEQLEAKHSALSTAAEHAQSENRELSERLAESQAQVRAMEPLIDGTLRTAAEHAVGALEAIKAEANRMWAADASQASAYPSQGELLRNCREKAEDALLGLKKVLGGGE